MKCCARVLECCARVHECCARVHERTSARAHGRRVRQRYGRRRISKQTGREKIHRFGSTHKHNGAPDGVHCRPAASASEQQRQQGSKQRRAAGGSNSASRASGAGQAASKQQAAAGNKQRGRGGAAVLGLLNGEDLVLLTGKEVLLVVDHSLNVLHGVVGLNLKGRGLTVAVLRKICIPLPGRSVK